MKKRYFFLSLTRITDLKQNEIEIIPIDRKEWTIGQYVACKVVSPPGTSRVEMQCGRMAEVAEGDILIGAFGDRFATLSATGTYKEVSDDKRMHLLTSAGLFGKVTSISSFVPKLVEIEYLGNIFRNDELMTMNHFVPKEEFESFHTPVVLVVGTSMSAGKTTSAKIAIRQLRLAGLKVVAAKLTGAGRYRDTLGMYDAGAEFIVDFVDAGLPSTVVPPNDYIKALKIMLGEIQKQNADVVVIEIGASPMESYNGTLAIKYINPMVKFRILCASDPYAVYGVMKAFGSKPDLVCGIATNTLGGRKLIEKLSNVPSLNIIYPDQLKIFKKELDEKVINDIIYST